MPEYILESKGPYDWVATGIRKDELIRCKNCSEWKVRCGIKRNYCEEIGCVVEEDDFCSKAKPKVKK